MTMVIGGDFCKTIRILPTTYNQVSSFSLPLLHSSEGGNMMKTVCFSVQLVEVNIFVIRMGHQRSGLTC